MRQALVDELYALGGRDEPGETLVRIEEAVAAINSRWSIETRHAEGPPAPLSDAMVNRLTLGITTYLRHHGHLLDARSDGHMENVIRAAIVATPFPKPPALAAEGPPAPPSLDVRLPDPAWCDCDRDPVYGIKAGRHLPSCRYGVVLDYLDIHDPRAVR
jgi:phage tail protein X